MSHSSARAGPAEITEVQRRERKKLKTHKKWALKNAGARSSKQTKYHITTFERFLQQTGWSKPSSNIQLNAEIFENFSWWIQRSTEIHCDFKILSTFLRSVLRKFNITSEAFAAWSTSTLNDFKKAFNKSTIKVPKVNLAFNRQRASALLLKLRTSNYINDDLLYTAMLVYLITSLRPGNILKGTSDKDHSLALKMNNVYERKRSGTSEACMFILNDRHKNSKEEPVLTAVPYNKHTTNPKLFCAASRLKSAWRKRRNSGANDSDCVFINQRSKFPLSTSVANKRIQSIMTAVFEEENKPTEWAKFYTLKSARKAVASLMKELGCSPQTIAIQLKHKTLDSQMHYIGKFYKDQPGLNRALYKDL